MFAGALRLLGTKSALVVHGHDGLDEISVCAPTRVSELKDDSIRTYDINPDDFFGRLASPIDLKGGTPSENAEITKNILKGEKGPKRDVILLNAAAALMAAEKAKDLKEGIKLAENAIDSGASTSKLAGLAKFTQENG